jgi:thioester reductase-like protein
LITGANGSLGSQIFLQLLNESQVSRIYCLLRGEDAANRLRNDMQARKQDTTVLQNTSRVIILSMDLTDNQLGQSTVMYEQLQREVTDIIHSAWKMDFNLSIKDFDRECLQGLYQLLKLASSSSSQIPMRFHFISSIASAGSGLLGEVKEEPLPRRPGIALAQGYGQSKYAGEHICWTAMNHWGK